MFDQIKILIIDDHPTMVEGYQNILNSNFPDGSFKITVAYNCKTAYHYITELIHPYDIILLDLALPSYDEAKIFSGEDLAILTRKMWKDTKIMMLTSHTEAFILYNLIKTINPEAVLIKSDFKSEELLNALTLVMNGGIYYTYIAKQSIKEVGMNHSALDTYDRRIISLLSKGIKTKNLPDHIGLSISAIDKRKAQIKVFFDVQKGNDEDILREARKKGLV